jgi:Skp family chaperone for outer membrane proteins
MNRVITTLFVATGILLIAGAISFASAEDNFTQADRERLVRMEATQTVFMQQVDKRFEQVDKRFDELRSDMNARFEQVDKRFEQVDKRFEQMTNMFYTLSAIFTSLFVAVFGFAWWDRRTMLTSAKKAAREEVNMSTADIREEMVILKQFFEVMKKYAEKTPDLKELMSRAHLL